MKTRALVVSAALIIAGTPLVANVSPAFAIEDKGAVDMNEARFWQIIADSLAGGSDQDKQAAALRASLERLTPGEIEGFADVFSSMMRRSYSWDLWGAGYLAEGGMSDDGFEYFRCWLIAKGERTFKKVSADPDALAGILSDEDDGEFEFEEFGQMAREVWETKTGRDGQSMPSHGQTYNKDPSGTRFREDPVALKKRYPKLWARFGGD